MTIEDLIEKLKTEQKNGVYYVLFSWYRDLKNLCKEYKTEEAISRRLSLSERINEIYRGIDGFIWGLSAVNYISEEERDKLSDELMKIKSGYHNKHENGETTENNS